MKLSSSYISLNRLRFHARHGVLPQERATGGEFIVSVRAKYLFDKALESDNVDDTINYAEIFEIINKEMLTPSCLLEHLAGRIGRSIFNRMPMIESLDITVEKTNPPMGADSDGAAVELHLINDKTF
ncbi:dihydroneopterin aldolase [Marseilla massiliensis]|uniref:7,8-dihydroneopterin aldolase n=1 Tax=Marseilla massiliensis TaxID=1841864 RepID=A0A938WVC0_9BACT|nr:dihydroneopterin aldolase [Marseilla massiliensis]MBM6674241.1 dihydroneopterin aldolase [Marseilla massiliensis]CCY66300.1 dihydroneopterin aldolase [Prevotella sp. CAG:1124]